MKTERRRGDRSPAAAWYPPVLRKTEGTSDQVRGSSPWEHRYEGGPAFDDNDNDNHDHNTVPPSIPVFRVTPRFLWEANAVAPCSTATASNAEVQASDDVGLASVRLEWTGGGKSGSLELDGVGTDWTGSLSFPSGTFQIAGSAAFVTVSAIATDTSRNSTASPTTFDLEVLPCT
jgi:hypothetical protein